MGANPKDQFATVAQWTGDALRPFPGSRRIEAEGNCPDNQIGTCEIAQTATPIDDGHEPDLPLLVYDTTGSFFFRNRCKTTVDPTGS